LSVTSHAPTNRIAHHSSAPVVFGTTFIALFALVVASIVLIGHRSLDTQPAWSLVKYPVGVASTSEPSGFAPPTSGSLAGYAESYVNDFTSPGIPIGWDVFTGVPTGDPGAQFGSAHTIVNGGMLELNTWRDPAYANNWVTGGICQCGHSQMYGAYIVRSRITGSGPNEVELLWPQSNQWPPEIDFNETGGSMGLTSATVHYGSTNNIDQSHLAIDLSQWHTFGVEWTPTLITYFVDGRAWGRTSNSYESPHVPMTLDFEQRTSCDVHAQCPERPASLLVDWVAEFTPSN
jgi:hypothetical protein